MASIDKECFATVLGDADIPTEIVAFQVIRFIKKKAQSRFPAIADKQQMGTRQWLKAVTGKPRMEESGRALMEAFGWLENNGLIAEEPFGLHEKMNVYRLTVAGEAIETESDLAEFECRIACRKELLHLRISAKCWSAFLSGDYSTSVFAAFKEVEVAVRDVGKFTDSDYGENLMKKAFLPGGKLADPQEVKGEQQALANLFLGAVGRFRNPSAHRHVEVRSPEETFEMLAFASHLMRIVLDRDSAQSHR